MKSIGKTVAIAAALYFLLPLAAQAEKYAYRGKVVHTRLAPVIVHRVFPPYLGNHVYEGRFVRRMEQ